MSDLFHSLVGINATLCCWLSGVSSKLLSQLFGEVFSYKSLTPSLSVSCWSCCWRFCKSVSLAIYWLGPRSWLVTDVIIWVFVVPKSVCKRVVTHCWSSVLGSGGIDCITLGSFLGISILIKSICCCMICCSNVWSSLSSKKDNCWSNSEISHCVIWVSSAKISDWSWLSCIIYRFWRSSERFTQLLSGISPSLLSGRLPHCSIWSIRLWSWLSSSALNCTRRLLIWTLFDNVPSSVASSLVSSCSNSWTRSWLICSWSEAYTIGDSRMLQLKHAVTISEKNHFIGE